MLAWYVFKVFDLIFTPVETHSLAKKDGWFQPAITRLGINIPNPFWKFENINCSLLERGTVTYLYMQSYKDNIKIDLIVFQPEMGR